MRSRFHQICPERWVKRRGNPAASALAILRRRKITAGCASLELRHHPPMYLKETGRYRMRYHWHFEIMRTGPIDPSLLAKLPAEYLQEDIGHRLVIVASVFIALQTIFCILFYISRRLNKTLNEIEYWLYMPMSFLFNIAICLCAIRKLTMLHRSFPSRALIHVHT